MRLISIVLPTYNQLQFLPDTIASVLAQGWKSWELVIVNDGSTDGTKEYLDALSNPRIKVVHQPNGRLPNALNTGFTLAKGEYLTWISSDNVCAPYMLEALAFALDNNDDVGFVYSAHADIDEHGSITKVIKNQPFNYASLIARNAGIASFMYRRECQEAVGLYDTALEGAEDWDYWIRIIEHFDYMYVPEVLYYYRRHSESMNQRQKEGVKSSSSSTFTKTMLRNNNSINLPSIYRTLNDCDDQQTAQADACWYLGNAFIKSPYVPLDETAAVFEYGLQIKPDHVPMMANLVICMLRSGRWQEAVPYIESISKLEPKKMATFVEQCVKIYKKANPAGAKALTICEVDDTASELMQREYGRKRVCSFTEAMPILYS